ncbi:GNAT family N-acetyltransferase [Sphingomonas sp.]|uniref:GNAT family N-acetyltransferase n=1 Tax=Sphingomonas sp. TaxID=28214 RepID=UPI002FC7B1EF
MIATSQPGVRLRFAQRQDAALVLSFIRELAEFEQLAHQVVANEDTLADSLFGEHPAAEVVIAEVDGEPAAFALFFHNYSTFLGRRGLYLEDLFVRPRFRGEGLGRLLMTFLARLALERGCGRFEWWVLDWNTDALGFYRDLGATGMDDWTVQRISGDALQRLAAQFDSATH